MIKFALINLMANDDNNSLHETDDGNPDLNLKILQNNNKPHLKNEDDDRQKIVFKIQFNGNEGAELLRKIREQQTQVCFILSDEENESTDQKKFLAETHSIMLNNKTNISLLTKREIDIMNHLSKGLLYKEIAKDMGISIQTVKNHLKNIYPKLHVNNRSEAIVKYLNYPEKPVLITI